MSVKKLDILLDELNDDYCEQTSDIVRRNVLSDFDRKYTKTDSSWLCKKWIFIIMVWIINLTLMFCVMFTKWGIYLIYPFITLPKIRDDLYILSGVVAMIFKRYTALWGPQQPIDLQNKHITIASLVTSYTENYKSVQQNITNLLDVSHSENGLFITNLVICVCDGPVIGKYNDTALSEIFIQDMKMLQPKISRKYETWEGHICEAELHYGIYGESLTPLLLIKKKTNQGKKDGLLLAKGIVDSINDGDIEFDGLRLPIKYVYSTDADTVTQPGSLERGVEWMQRYPDVDAGVFILRVKFNDELKCKMFWGPFQDFQYFSSQYVRRNAESVFGKVTCLSGSGNICDVDSESYKYANKRYAEYPRTTSIMDVATKMIGTDRRYTTLKLKYSRDVKLVMFYDTFVYTETPQNLNTYISQRKRWGTNTLSNSLVNITSRNIPWFTKLSAVVDILRLVASYFRFVSFIYFWVFLFIGEIRTDLIIFLGVTIGTVYLYTFICIIVVGERKLSLLWGFLLNKLITPLITVRIFTEIMLNFDDFKWGSTQQIKGMFEEEEEIVSSPKAVVQQHTHTLPLPYNNEHNNATEDRIISIDNPINQPEKKHLNRHASQQTKIEIPCRENSSKQSIKVQTLTHKSNIQYGLAYQPPETIIQENQINIDKIVKIPKMKEEEIEDIPTSLRELDICDSNTEDDNDDTSEIEAKYSVEWKKKNNFATYKTQIENISHFGNNPPPPPPPPQFNLNLTTKNTRKRTRKLHWKPLPPDMAKKSFWRLSTSSLIPQFENNIEDKVSNLFEITETQHNNKKSDGLQILVSLNRANNAGIILKRIRRQFPNDEECLKVIMNSLIHITPKQISTDQIQSFMSFLPLDNDEIENLRNYKEEHSLIFVDKFFIQSLTIPRLWERLKCEQIKRTVGSLIDYVDKYCTIMQNICVELKENTKFKQFLAIILKFGKILNKESGQSTIGFKLESLKLLKQTKTNKTKHSDNVKSFLDLVLIQTKKDSPHIMTFVDELDSLNKIKEISIEDLKHEQKNIYTCMQFMKKEIKFVSKRIIELDELDENQLDKKMFTVFFTKYHEFYKITNKQAKKLKHKIEETEHFLDQIITYYGDTSSSSNEFFAIIRDFIEDIKENHVFQDYLNVED